MARPAEQKAEDVDMRKCRFHFDGECEHGLTHECPMYEDNEDTCVDFEAEK